MDCSILQASDGSQKKSNFVGFSETDSRKFWGASFAKKKSVKNGQFR